jgi:hypothetical protein
MPRSQTPAGPFAPSHEDDRRCRGVAVAGGFRLRLIAARRCLIPSMTACLAASRRIRYCPLLMKRRGLQHKLSFGAQSRGLSTRCLRFAGRVDATPRKTRFRLVANLCRAGLNEPAGFRVKFQPCLHGVLLTQASPGAIHVKVILQDMDRTSVVRLDGHDEPSLRLPRSAYTRLIPITRYS